MFVSEADWIGRQIARLQFASQPIECLNLGSSTRDYREIKQPHVHNRIFLPLLQLGTVIHVDAKPAEGVDVSGDLMDEAFWEQIPNNAFDLVMCSNLLTHVTDQEKIYRLIRRSVAPGGYIIISTPQIYPYCADPLDTKYRPSRHEILANLDGFELTAATQIQLEETHYSRLKREPKAVMALAANILLPVRGFARWKAVVSDIPNIFKPLTTICLILRAPRDEKRFGTADRAGSALASDGC
jgi:SAM-dependent methyltransferase